MEKGLTERDQGVDLACEGMAGRVSTHAGDGCRETIRSSDRRHGSRKRTAVCIGCSISSGESAAISNPTFKKTLVPLFVVPILVTMVECGVSDDWSAFVEYLRNFVPYRVVVVI